MNRQVLSTTLLSLRLLKRRPGFAAVALTTLALGIGAPTAIFSVVHAVLLRPLPYPEPDRILQFRMEVKGPQRSIGFDALPATAALEWAAGSSTLTAIALFNDRALTLSAPDGPFRLSGIAATPNLFELLGVAPALGRTPDSASTDVRQIVLSHATWLRHFWGSPAVIGSPVTFDGEVYRVTGVMPERFQFPSADAAFWVPLLMSSGGGRGMLLPAVARMAPDATVAAVIEEGRRLIDETRGSSESKLLALTLQEQMIGSVQRVLWILMAAVSLVTVIATANIALLLLVRGAGREREFSIRLAIGASRGQLIRQLFFEGMILALIGGAAGLLLAGGMLELLLRLAPRSMPRLQDAALSGPVLAFAVAVTAGSSLVFGILSAGRSIATDQGSGLMRSGGSLLAGAGTPRRRLNVLAAAELALTVVLLVGAGLLLRSFVALVLVDQGFDGRGSIALQITLPASRYPTPAARVAFHERLLERLKQVPGVTTAGLITAMPNRQPTGRFDYNPIAVPAAPDPMSMTIAEVRMASEGFLEAMGVPLRAGRTFRADDASGAEPVMIVSERLARLHFGDQDPVGRLLYSLSGTRRVVGVVGDVRPASEFFTAPAAYLPVRQTPDLFSWHAGMNVVARGRNPDALAASLRTIILSMDPEMPAYNVRTLSAEVSALVAGPRFSASVLAVFAAVALVLAAVGVYGVMAYSTGQRTREIGVRVALGATRRQVLGLMIRDGVMIVAAGLIAGLVAAALLARGLTGLLHDVQPADPVTLGVVAALLSCIGLIAAYLPARRATRLNALDALRHD